jgi:hypothetical protein
VLVQKEKKSNAFEDVSTYMVFNPKNKENEDIAAKDVDK